MDNSTEAEDARDNLLCRIKKQYQAGPMAPRLVVVTGIDGIVAPDMRLQWEYYAGMGDTDLHDLSPREAKAANELVEQGYIVPTFDSSITPGWTTKLYEHFDDVNWGYNQDGVTVIYDLLNNRGVLTLDESHTPAIEELHRRIEYVKTMMDQAIVVEGQKISPILTDRNFINLRKLQLDES